jgi:hypothetical protein
MVLLKCNTIKAKGKYHITSYSFFITLIKLMHEHNKFTIMQYPKDTLEITSPHTHCPHQGYANVLDHFIVL